MGTMVFYFIFLPLIYYYYIFYVFGSLCTIEKIYNNNKIMVKKIKIKELNKKQCSHDAWEQWFFI